MKIRKKDWIEGEIEEGKETGWYRMKNRRRKRDWLVQQEKQKKNKETGWYTRKNRGRIKSLAVIKGEIKEE